MMKIDWTSAAYSGTRQWLLNLGQKTTGANHWLWNGGSSIQFGKWNGQQIRSYDISSCNYLATTYDSSSSEYVLYCDGVEVAQRTISGGLNIQNDNVRIGDKALSESDFSGCVERVLIYREALTQQGVLCAMAQINSGPA